MRTPSAKSLPRHVAIIMDGNGRWAKQRGRPRIEGHRQGAEAVKRTIRAAGELGIPYLTLFAFSVENWKRPAAEVDALMQMLSDFIVRQESVLHERKIRFRALGRLDELPEDVRLGIDNLMRDTAHYTEWNLNLALNYGARTEVLDAVHAYAQAVARGAEERSPPTWETFRRYLYTDDLPDPDLIVRTSGEYRLSNFLLLQAAYAEIHVSPVLWPDFNKQSLLAALQDFQARERRFGLTGEQLRQTTASATL